MEDKVKAEETPTLTEEKPKEKAEEKPTTEQDVDGLLAELEKAGVSNVEQLENKLTASSQAGNLANQLGTARGEIAELKELIQAGQVREEQPYQQEETDLRTLMKSEVRAGLKEQRDEDNKLNLEAQQASLNMYNAIQNDPDFHLIKDVWEKKTADPNFQVKVQQGLTNPYVEYNALIRDYYKGIARRSVETIKTLQGKGDVTIPHVEGEGQVTAPRTEAEKTAQEEKMVKYKEKVDKGGKLTEEEEMDALMVSLTK